jgi:isopentenyl phosphate kinase
MGEMNVQTINIPNLYFLKLGGSLITDKRKPGTPRSKVIARLALEIKKFLHNTEDIKLLLGHGSGSFGHVPAIKYGTRLGVKTQAQWDGFAEVWFDARMLNQIVIEILHKAGLPAISFPVSAGVNARDGKIETWNLTPIQSALDSGTLPVVFGDVAFDSVRGGTILSTEDIFVHLARDLHPRRILLAGIAEGVWSDYPQCTQLIQEITPANWRYISDSLSGSEAVDVTGGMESKVQSMVDLVTEHPNLDIQIFSGNQSGYLSSALKGEKIGTRIKTAN